MMARMGQKGMVVHNNGNGYVSDFRQRADDVT